MGKAENDAELERLDALFRADLEQYCRCNVKIKNNPDAANNRSFKSGKLIPFVWNEEQRYVHARLEEQKAKTGKVRALILKPRQRGISTYIQAKFYQKTTSNLGQNTFILTHEDKATKNLLGIVQRIHENMSPEFKVHATKDSADAMAFQSVDSKYSLATALTKATGRSDNIQNYHGSEVAFWANPEDHAGASLNAVPDAKGTEIVLESTANGVGNWFYSQWLLAEAGISDYQAIFFPWFWAKGLRKSVPEGFVPSPDELEYQELYGLDEEQLCWMHYKNISQLPPGGDPEKICWKFRQEYPATAQEAFQLSGEQGLIRSELYYKARKNVFDDKDYEDVILGLDPARGGEDRSRLMSRAGRIMGAHVNLTWNIDDEVEMADNMMIVIKEVQRIWPGRLKKVFIDITGGTGKGCHDILKRQSGLKDMIRGVIFSNKATEEKRYVNKRAEIWARMAKWFAQIGGVDAPDDDTLHRHVCGPRAEYRKGRLIMELKKLIKKRLGFSPDGGDAGALTFTEEIIDDDGELLPEWARYLAETGSQGGWQVQ